MEMARSSEDFPALGSPTWKTGTCCSVSSVCEGPRSGRASGRGAGQPRAQLLFPVTGGRLEKAGLLPARPVACFSTGSSRRHTAQSVKCCPLPPGASGDTYQPGVGHGLELQEEDPLLPGLPGRTGHWCAVIVGQEKAVALSSCPAEGGDVLVTRARQVSQNCVSLLHQSAYRDLQNRTVLTG